VLSIYKRGHKLKSYIQHALHPVSHLPGGANSLSTRGNGTENIENKTVVCQCSQEAGLQ
jgi:hypothetical protein